MKEREKLFTHSVDKFLLYPESSTILTKGIRREFRIFVNFQSLNANKYTLNMINGSNDSMHNCFIINQSSYPPIKTKEGNQNTRNRSVPKYVHSEDINQIMECRISTLPYIVKEFFNHKYINSSNS